MGNPNVRHANSYISHCWQSVAYGCFRKETVGWHWFFWSWPPGLANRGPPTSEMRCSCNCRQSYGAMPCRVLTTSNLETNGITGRIVFWSISPRLNNGKQGERVAFLFQLSRSSLLSWHPCTSCAYTTSTRKFVVLFTLASYGGCGEIFLEVLPWRVHLSHSNQHNFPHWPL